MMDAPDDIYEAEMAQRVGAAYIAHMNYRPRSDREVQQILAEEEHDWCTALRRYRG